MPIVGDGTHLVGTREPPLTVLLEYARLANVYLEVMADDALTLPQQIPARTKNAGVNRTPALPRKRQS